MKYIKEYNGFFVRIDILVSSILYTLNDYGGL